MLALASLRRDEVERVPEVLKLLDDPERMYDLRESARKWLYLQLKAAYDAHGRLEDLLGVVEQIYEEFDYPEAIEPFVRYMPLRPEDRPGVSQLMARWLNYLTSEMVVLSRGPEGTL